MRDHVILPMRLIIVQMLETSRIRMSKQEWHICVPIIDTIEFFSFEEVLQVMFYDWALSNCCGLSSGRVNSNTITECKDILVSLVLEGVRVDINETFSISKTAVNKFLVWLGWRVNNS